MSRKSKNSKMVLGQKKFGPIDELCLKIIVAVVRRRGPIRSYTGFDTFG